MRRSVMTISGLTGLLVLGMASTVASADLLNFHNGAFEISASSEIGPDQSIDTDSQSGDLSTNPFDLSVSTGASLDGFDTSASATQLTAWNGNSINSMGASLAGLTVGSSPTGSVNWSSNSYTNFHIEFTVTENVFFDLSGTLFGANGNLADVVLENMDSGVEIEAYSSDSASIPFAAQGGLVAGVNYRLSAGSAALSEGIAGLSSETNATGFNVNFSVTAIPGPGALSLLCVGGFFRSSRRRRG